MTISTKRYPAYLTGVDQVIPKSVAAYLESRQLPKLIEYLPFPFNKLATKNMMVEVIIPQVW